MLVRRLIAAVYVKDPATHEDLILLPGQSPEPQIAALVTHPDAWEKPAEPGDPAGSALAKTPSPADDSAASATAGPSRKTGQRRSRPSTE